MSGNQLITISKTFAVDIIELCETAKNRRKATAIINQLLRSGTSIGANIHEAQFAQGTKDFISKLEIALKECNECDYWLDILLSTQSIDTLKSSMLSAECDEIRKILISSVNTLKSKQKPDAGSN